MKEKLRNLWQRTVTWFKKHFTLREIVMFCVGMLVNGVINKLLGKHASSQKHDGTSFENGGHYVMEFVVEGDKIEGLMVDVTKCD